MKVCKPKSWINSNTVLKLTFAAFTRPKDLYLKNLKFGSDLFASIPPHCMWFTMWYNLADVFAKTSSFPLNHGLPIWSSMTHGLLSKTIHDFRIPGHDQGTNVGKSCYGSWLNHGWNSDDIRRVVSLCSRVVRTCAADNCGERTVGKIWIDLPRLVRRLFCEWKHVICEVDKDILLLTSFAHSEIPKFTT